MDSNRAEYVRATAQVEVGDKVGEARAKLRKFGHLQRSDSRDVGQRMSNIELPGKRKRGRAHRRFTDVVKEDICGDP